MSKDREELIEVMAEARFQRDQYHGYNAETLSHRWVMQAKAYRRAAEDDLSAIEAAGFVVVPRVPTPEMINAVAKGFGPADRYRAMINAYSPKTGGGEGE